MLQGWLSRHDELVEKLVRFLKVAIDDNTADLFSKPLNWNHFVKLRLGLDATGTSLHPWRAGQVRKKRFEREHGCGARQV